MGGWVDGWMDGRAGLRIAYSNQKAMMPLQKVHVRQPFHQLAVKIKAKNVTTKNLHLKNS